MTPVRLEPAALRSRVKHSTTEPLRSLHFKVNKYNCIIRMLIQCIPFILLYLESLEIDRVICLLFNYLVTAIYAMIRSRLKLTDIGTSSEHG